jgi:hypothetical protein
MCNCLFDVSAPTWTKKKNSDGVTLPYVANKIVKIGKRGYQDGQKELMRVVGTCYWRQWLTQEFFFLGGGGSTNSVEDGENRDLGAAAP